MNPLHVLRRYRRGGCDRYPENPVFLTIDRDVGQRYLTQHIQPLVLTEKFQEIAMDQGLIPRRYAKALYLHAVERHCDRPLYEVMRRLSAAFGREPGLNDALANPFVAYSRSLSIATVNPPIRAESTASVYSADAPSGRCFPTKAGGETGKEAEDAAFADFLKLLGQNKRLVCYVESECAHFIAETLLSFLTGLLDSHTSGIHFLFGLAGRFCAGITL